MPRLIAHTASVMHLLRRLEFRSHGYLSPPVTIIMAALLIGLILSLTPARSALLLNGSLYSGEVHRLLTSHIIPFSPIAGLFSIVLVGFLYRPVQGHLGHKKLLYALGGIQLVCALVSLLLADIFMGFRPGIYLLLTAFATIAPTARMIFFFIPMPAWLLVSLIIAIDILISLEISLESGNPFLHLTPLLGVAAGFLLIRQPNALANWQGKRKAAKEQRQRQQRDNDDQELDRILAKVNEVGIGELTKAEKKFLDQYHQRHSS